MEVVSIGAVSKENAPAVFAIINELLREAEGPIALSILANALAFEGCSRGIEKEVFMASVTDLLSQVYDAQVAASTPPAH